VGASAEQEPAEKAAAQAPRKTQQVLALPKAGVGGKGHLTKASEGKTNTRTLAEGATLLAASGALLGATEVFWGGSGLGGALVAAHALFFVCDGASRVAAQPQPGLTVVVTGATRGLGKALARAFVARGDRVVLVARSQHALAQVAAELRAIAPRGGDAGQIATVRCDVSSPAEVSRLAAEVRARFGRVDMWLNNAAYNPGNKPLLECTAAELEGVAGTNLLGAMLCTKTAVEVIRDQEGAGGHIFNFTGRGGDGTSSPGTAAYGATKAGMMQFKRSLVAELDAEGLSERVGLHTISPGMVLTDLLLRDTTPAMRQAFNVICEQPETVAEALVPRMRATRGTGKHLAFLTGPRIARAVLGAWARRGRWFDEEGQRVYRNEAERLKQWERTSARKLRRAASGDWRPRGLDAAADALPVSAWAWLYGTSAAACFVALQYDGAPPLTTASLIHSLSQMIDQLGPA